MAAKTKSELSAFGVSSGRDVRLSATDEYRRDHLVRVIERSVEAMTLAELEALSYDMFTKGYIDQADI